MTVAPERGLVWSALQRRRQRQQIRTDVVLGDLFALARQHEGEHAHDLGVLEAMRASRGDVRRALEQLLERGLARQDERGRWLITDAGRHAATTNGSHE
jgi:DNA-binding IclR family transcriptional regulator